MGYYLQAFICKQAETNILTDKFNKAKGIEIGQGLTLVPMTKELFDEINESVVSNSVNKSEYLTDNIEIKVLKLMADKRFAYVEAEYFGGEGGQIAITWNNQKRENLLEYGQECINSVLKDFGVKNKIGIDEFETLELGRHRNTIDWVEDNY